MYSRELWCKGTENFAIYKINNYLFFMNVPTIFGTIFA